METSACAARAREAQRSRVPPGSDQKSLAKMDACSGLVRISSSSAGQSLVRATGSALRLLLVVLEPGENNDDDVEQSQEHHGRRMGEGEAIGLIADKRGQGDDHRWVRPKLIPE